MEAEDCAFGDGDSDVFTYTISLDDFVALKNLTVLVAGGAGAEIVFDNPCFFVDTL